MLTGFGPGLLEKKASTTVLSKFTGPCCRGGHWHTIPVNCSGLLASLSVRKQSAIIARQLEAYPSIQSRAGAALPAPNSVCTSYCNSTSHTGSYFGQTNSHPLRKAVHYRQAFQSVNQAVNQEKVLQRFSGNKYICFLGTRRQLG